MTAVSVIIPVFNGAATIGRTLESALDQTMMPAEIVVIDDGSNDDTTAIVGRYPAVQLVRQSNQGAAAARNHGVRLARSPLLAFLDADDIWHPTKLKRQTSFLTHHPDVDYVLCHMEVIFEGFFAEESYLRHKLNHYQSQPAAVVPSALVVRRAVFDQVGWFNPRYVHTDDSDWFLRARDLNVNGVTLPEPLLTKSIRPHSNLSAAAAVQKELLAQLRDSVKRQRTITPSSNGGLS